MASGIVIHIEAGEDKHTEVLPHELIRIGASEECELWLRSSDLPPTSHPPGVVLQLTRTNGFYRITGFDPALEITHNGAPLKAEAKIKDGDEVRIRDSNIALQFFPVRDLPAVTRTRHEPHIAPFIEHAAIESAATARRDDAKVFLREFTRELVREINLSTKLITLAIAIALVGGMLYLGYNFVRELQQSRGTIDEQRKRIEQTNDQVDKVNALLADLMRANKELRDSISIAVKMRSEYGRGVCLISGSYYFVETGTGRSLRYPEVQTNEDGTVIQNEGESLQLTPEGTGPIAEFEFVGTGFYVGDGYVLTNRHIAQPWLGDERAQALSSTVSGQPRLRRLMAFFPDHSQPIGLKFRIAAQRDDLAVCTLETKELPIDIPVLPLEKDSDAIVVGQQVVMMGYPSGPDRLLALLDDTEARSIQARYGASLESLLAYLSEKNRIQPLTTQGHITDLDVRRIVYDARTAEGGSGAPLFGQSGRVIGINFAVFTENTASNFAVPVRYGVALLQRAGWEPPEPPERAQSDGANQTNPRGTTGTTSPAR
ncbi:MAG TPA: trypsin-like peptidase domain-containing protein [Pyrinomonadaceae bacterium]|nr:trypsin-like peptidase domain-containing protein [Pyrinomonadaceae bacterium]